MAAPMLWPSGLERGADELLEYKRRAVRLITRTLHVARCTDGAAPDSELASPNFLICGDDLHVKMLMTPSLDIDGERGIPIVGQTSTGL